MKFVFISDTHQNHNIELPKGDVLIHSGDACNSDRIQEIINFNTWIQKQFDKFNEIIYVPGNHDSALEHHFNLIKVMLDSRLHILIDKEININGIKIYGSPWTPAFGDWSFQLHTKEDAIEKWERIPKNIDILVTHGPPKGILDYVQYDNMNVGCPYLFDAVNKIKPKVHAFGHIHEQYGQYFFNGTQFINAAFGGRIKEPIIVEL